MKNHLLILTILLLTLTIVHGQTNVYHPFPDSAIWRIDVVANSPQGGGCQAHYYFQYYISGDTLINSFSYKKIYKSFVYHTSTGAASPCDPLPLLENSGYIGALRDDSVSNKTFFVFQNNNNDSILFDYNLNVGDTIKGCIALNDIIIISVDSILIGSQERKKWNYNTGQIIQGIGSESGLIELINTGSATYSSLVCVKDSTSTLFTSGYNSAMGCNMIYEGLNEINFENILNCYPNPFTMQTTLRTDNIFKDAILTVFNSFGQQVKQIKNISGQTIILHRDNLPCGLYILRLTQDNKIFSTDKLVITDN